MRVYLGASAAMIAELSRTGQLAPGAEGFAATAPLRAALGEIGDEDLEFALSLAAAEASAAMAGVGPEGRGRRFVVVADVDAAAVEPAADNPGAVAVTTPVALDRVDAVLADPDDIAVHRGVSDELAWYARQEIPDLLA